MTARSAGRSALALGALGALAPLNLAATAVALVVGGVRRRPVAPSPTGTTVLVSGGKMTKALTLCRAFHAAGHRVVLVEAARYRLTGHRFSRAVSAFHTVPGARDPGYAEALADVARREGATVYVPVCAPATSLPDARAKAALEPGCRVVHPDPEQVEMLDDKHLFNRAAAGLGLPVPDTHRVTDAQEVLDFDFAARPHTYILKSIAYDPVHRLDLTRYPMPEERMRAHLATLPISPANPWILQEYVEGRELCTHGTAVDGRLTVFCCCESSAFQVNYASVERPRVRAWVERFVAEHHLSGQVSFDFMETADGDAYPIECNPRTHSAITLFKDHPDLAAAYLEPERLGGRVLTPEPTARPTYWLYHELWRLLRGPRRRERLAVLRDGVDAIFDVRDPLPFLLVHHLQVPALLLGSLRRGGRWLRIDFNIGKLVEPAGD